MREYIFILCILHAFFLGTVSGVDISLVPTQVVLTTQIPAQTSVTCSPGGTSNIKEIYSIQIKRKRPSDSGHVALVEVSPNNNPSLVDTITQEAPDIENRNPTLTGSIDTNTPSLSTLKMELNTNAIVCNDVAEFQCELVYKDTSNNILTETASSNLTVYALPKDLGMTVTKGGFTVGGGTVSSPAAFVVGEVVTISCTGKIGSDNTTSVRWRITSELSSTDTFIDYNPPAGTGSESQPGDYSDCSWSRTATINYNMTAADANRANNLIFQCYISVTPPGQSQYEIPNPPMFYIDVTNPNSANTGEVATAGSGSDLGGIIGGVVGGLVLIVIVVLLVYFLWYRKRGDGAAYRTREDTSDSNPNLAPQPEPYTYSVPHKTKKGHENPNLDEPHESKPRHHYNDNHHNHGRGRPNYGMDDDDDDYHSRDGSPSRNHAINHMGMDDNGSFGTGV